MDVINYLKGKGNKVEVDSPQKKGKQLSSAQQIYLQQIGNYIQVEGGYDVLKDRLFIDLNNNYMHDSPLVQEIIIKLRNGLTTFDQDKQLRCITIIEDLLTNCSPLMNEAFNDKKFCKTLSNTCLFYGHVRTAKRKEIRERVCGIFLYWHIKLKQQPNYVYLQFYEQLRTQQAKFPSIPFIKQVPPKIKQQTQTNKKQSTQLIAEILSDSEQAINNAENMLKIDRSKIDTNMVRLLKIKNKKLYELSTSTQIELTSLQKQKTSQIYKKIRAFLKELEKQNISIVKNTVLQKQKQFIEFKQSPQKIQKQIPKIPMQSKKKISDEQKEKTEKDLIIISPVKQTIVQENVTIQNLLDIEINDIQPKIPNKNQQQISPLPQRSTQLTSPTKNNQIKVSQELLDLCHDDYSSPRSTKRLDFKQLYSQNSLSPQLKDINLQDSSKKMKERQKIKSSGSDDEQFGQFK